ncbi:hypothetical protein KIW84_054461 [Lathyrus oleraceus]|uniref:Uncharacterized protein n=1 Tax=Pisum sativum TaxID=3888 RepID=A0A9D4WXP2_PEA|nr:hypothetical protein KIW84_054461 [Pisum sativum]
MAGEDDPLKFPSPLDSMLNKELAIGVVYQPKYGILSVVDFKDGEDSTKKLRDQFPTEEESMSACADYDPVSANLGLTPSKRSADESLLI